MALPVSILVVLFFFVTVNQFKPVGSRQLSWNSSELQSCFQLADVDVRMQDAGAVGGDIRIDALTRMKPGHDGLRREDKPVPASFFFSLPDQRLDRAFQGTGGLILDADVVDKFLHGQEPYRSKLKKKLGGHVKYRPLATFEDIKNLGPFLDEKNPANKLGLSEKLHRTCAVVGNSWRLRQCDFGSKIDNHDAVFRINNAPTENFQKWVGSKTTYMVMNPTASYNKSNYTIVKQSILKSDVRSLRRNPRTFWFILQKPIRYVNLHKTFMYNGTVQPLNPGSSTGMLALKLAMGICSETSAFGFTTEEEESYSHYYGAGRDGLQPRVQMKGNAGHDLLSNRVTYLFYNCTGLINFHTC